MIQRVISCFPQRGGGPAVRDPRQRPEREALMERVFRPRVKEREGLQADGRRPQWQDHQERKLKFEITKLKRTTTMKLPYFCENNGSFGP